MWRRIREIIRKEFKQMLREPRTRAFLFMPPIIQLLVFGYAVNLDVEQSRLAWLDQDRTSASRELQRVFEGSRHFRMVTYLESEQQVEPLLDRGEVDLVVRVPPGFGRDLNRGVTAQIQILVDGTNSNTASIIAANAAGAVAAFSNQAISIQIEQRLVGRTLAAGGPVHIKLPEVDLRDRIWFNPDLRSRFFFVPGVVVNIITLVTLMLTAMSIVREKELGTMEQLIVTPIRPFELIVGKTLPSAVVGLVDVLMVTGAAMLIFDVPVRGSFLVLLLASLAFLLSTLGVGLFISTICHTQQQAMMSSFFFFNPAFMLSGFTFPIRNMPLPVQYLSYLNPVRYMIEIVRSVFLKGVGLAVLWPQLVALALIGSGILTLSVIRFHKRLD